MYVYLRLSHAEVCQKRTQFCKAIILQLKNKLIKRNKKMISPGVPAFPLVPGVSKGKTVVPTVWGTDQPLQGPDRSHLHIWVCG